MAVREHSFERVAIKLMRSVPEYGFQLISLNEVEFEKAYCTEQKITPRESLTTQNTQTHPQYNPIPIIQIAQTGNLTNFLSDDIIQRQLDHLYNGGVKRMMTFSDGIIFILGICSLGFFPAICFPDYINLKHTKINLREFWNDIFGFGYFKFEQPNSEKNNISRCNSFVRRKSAAAENRLKLILQKVLTWNFSTRVIVASNVMSDVCVLIFIVYYLMGRMFYRWNEYDWAFVVLILLVNFSRMRPWFARNITALPEFTKPTRRGFFMKDRSL